ncbi:NAD(P)H-hydrate epimerase, partial [Ilumatobacter nonamiensis]|uniref:NAD(P)H-hydrate epimerase n=1 Tax=Ilumatobacter nonamiensis TaxID=467093 RepID=UPI00068790EB
MIPVVTPDEMRAIDAAAPEPVEVLIHRAGGAVFRAALDLLGGTYGRRVNVIAGAGNNGADGRDAAERLQARGVRVRVFDVKACPEELPPADLVIDAAFGTGFRAEAARPWTAPGIGDAPVLAVDIPSGVDSLSGEAGPAVLRADRTVTFQALKPGLVFGDGAALAGEVEVVDIGLDTGAIRCHLVEATDVASWWPTRPSNSHKWKSAVKVIAGSPGMPGAAELCTAAAARGGAGLVSLSAPGCRPHTRSEVVQREIPVGGFGEAALDDIGRFGALVIGPGLGRGDDTLTATRECIGDAPVPVVVDGDALFAVARSRDGAEPLLRRRQLSTVLTPHDGEFAQLTGQRPSVDRIASARAAADEFDSTVLLKGPTTVIASPPPSHFEADGYEALGWGDDGAPGGVLLVDRGDQRLATAGSGDVLSGLIGAALAAGAPPDRAAAAAA